MAPSETIFDGIDDNQVSRVVELALEEWIRVNKHTGSTTIW